MRKEKDRLGIDIGRVIVGRAARGSAEDTPFGGGGLEAILSTPPIEGAFQTIEQLTKDFDRRVWLVSKCGPKVESRSRKWLKHTKFFEKTGVPPKNLRFCLERPQKADHARRLRLTHFIDDRLDVLKALRGLVPNLYLFGPQTESRIPDWVTAVETWKDVASHLL